VARLTRLLFPVFPGGGSFRVQGPGARANGAPPPSGGLLLTCGGEHLELGTLQGRVDVTVALEEWDSAPPEGEADRWEEAASARVFLRGYVAVSGGTPGAARHVRLACGSGAYLVRVYARRRRAVAERYDQLLRRYRDARSAEFRVAEQRLCGQEEFLIRLWPAAARQQRTPGRDSVRYPTAVSG
jgi:hypothetical protein